ncbi:MAG: amidase [Egibacteraceae bacterium]
MRVRDEVEARLARIAERDPVVHAWAHLDPDLARGQADALDRDGPRGPLHGLPVGVKDIIDTAHLPTELGSPLHAGRRPAADAAVVTALRQAGALVLGKTVTTEFALYHPGATTNPHDARRTPGGSSSGSAAAAADGMAPLTLGTQTAGSIIRPASFCGVWGFKPTHGLLDTAGVLRVSATLDTLGLFSERLDVLVATFGALTGAAAAAVPPARPRIGFARTPQWSKAEPTTRTSLEQLAGGLADAGAEVVDVDLPELDGLVAAQQLIMAVEAAHNLGGQVDAGGDQVSAPTRELVAEGQAARATAYAAALEVAEASRDRMAGRFRDLDALLSPSAIGEAPVGLDSTGDPLFCRAWTLLGTPCLAVPGLRGPAGLPLGFQLIGPRGGDAALLALGAWFVDHLPAGTHPARPLGVS